MSLATSGSPASASGPSCSGAACRSRHSRGGRKCRSGCLWAATVAATVARSSRAELRVRVVEVRAHGACGQLEVERDLLVDLAVTQPPQDLDLARRQRARLD